MDHLRMDLDFARRYVNDGFSGGEMKRARDPADGNAQAEVRDPR